MVEKKCKTCGRKFKVDFYRKDKASYCSHKCYWKAISQGKYPQCGFQKGHGYIGGGVEKGRHLSPETEFKKGQTPWNKGKKLGPNWAWNKGLGTKGKTNRRKELDDHRYRKWRKKVFERDNYTCQRCGKKGVRLVADHIKMWVLYPRLRYEVSNGQTLCKECHKRKTAKELREYWINQYKSSYKREITKTSIMGKKGLGK